MSDICFEGPLVDVSWLREHLGSGKMVVLDGTLPKAAGNGESMTEPGMRIPTARFFDIRNTFSDVSADFPNTWPGEASFNKAARELGINNDSCIVVYDDHGIYSSARVWWMFLSMGHRNIAVLNGGRKAWIDAGYKMEPKKQGTYPVGDFKGQFQNEFFKDHNEVLKNITSKNKLVLDARAELRFKGVVEEPRKGLRSGHIPESLNLPYSDLLIDGKLRDEDELKSLFEYFVNKEQGLVFSCGSGITACVLALGAQISGYKDLSVYDGSWTEWGSLPELPVEKED